MILAGIDEAGYGPLLGPLVVSGVAFELPAAHAGADLWNLLSRSICRAPDRRGLRLAIADSKKLFNRKSGLAALERAALVMLATAGRRPRALRTLLGTVAPQAVEALASYPWYRDFAGDLPHTTTPEDIATRANAVRRDLAERGARLAGVFAEVVPAGEFNRQVARTHNKAAVLMGAALRVVVRILHCGADGARICVDRHGGREHYVDHLLSFFDGAELKVIEETAERSAYALRYGNRNWHIEFVTKGESRHLPVALASIYCKYLRELLMGALNAYFRTRLPGLTPTAGYYTDGLRFRDDIRTVMAAEGIQPEMLVRCR